MTEADEFIYWAHPTPPGIRVEEVSGLPQRPVRVWVEMARQIFCENGREGYRDMGHYRNGAPFLFSVPARISLTHTSGLFAVAMLPRTPEADLTRMSPRTALGIDAERLDRGQVLKVRERFLSDTELESIAADDLEANILAWTAKEAAYKAALHPGLDLRRDIGIETLPVLDRQMNRPGAPAPIYGRATVAIPGADGAHNENGCTPAPADGAPSKGSDNITLDLDLYSYESDGCCVTLAYSPKCAKFARS